MFIIILSGYFQNPKISSDGIIFTDNMYSTLYILKDNNIKRLFSSPNCGLYYSVFEDKIGFKMIYENGLQAPSIYDIKEERFIELHKPVQRAGEVSFSNNGDIAFTIEETLYTIRNERTEKHLLGTYSNLVPVSHNGDFVVYNDDKDQLYIYHLRTGKKEKITDGIQGYFNPVISPEDSFIAYSSLSGFIKIYNIKRRTTYNIGYGRGYRWMDAKNLIFYEIETDGINIINSDIFLSGYDGRDIFNLTKTYDKFEIEPLLINDNNIIFFSLNRYEIFKGKLEKNRIHNINTIFYTETLKINYFNIKSVFGPKDSINVPYIHQVYDTPDWHNGHWSCAPTTAMMAIAYYRKLPEWNVSCSYPYNHISHFGNYICSRYNYMNISYTDTAYDASGNVSWGGYGYMWTDGYSPYSRMYYYLINHNLNSWVDDTPTWEETVSEIQSGYPYCMCVGLTSAGHLVLAVGQVLNWHTLIFNDPYGNKNTPGYPSYDGKYARYDWPGYNNGYQNLNYVYWTRGARGEFTSFPDTIVDDLQFMYSGENYGFYIHNQPPSDMRYYRDNLSGFNNHFFWTYSTGSQDTCYVIWKPRLLTQGEYEVFAYIPSINANALAHYRIYHNDGMAEKIINQNEYSDEWVSLGTYYFSPNNGYVYLGDATGIPMQKIAFDAMRWSYKGTYIEEDSVHYLSSNIVKDAIVINIAGISCSNISYKIIDLNGRILIERKLFLNDKFLKINVHNLKKGVYFIIINSDKLNIKRKFIILDK